MVIGCFGTVRTRPGWCCSAGVVASTAERARRPRRRAWWKTTWLAIAFPARSRSAVTFIEEDR